MAPSLFLLKCKLEKRGKKDGGYEGVAKQTRKLRTTKFAIIPGWRRAKLADGGAATFSCRPLVKWFEKLPAEPPNTCFRLRLNYLLQK